MLLIILAMCPITVTASLFPLNTAFDITMEVLHKYRSGCIYLFHSTQESGLKERFESIKWKSFFGKKNILLTSIPVDKFESVNGHCRPLYVIPSSNWKSQFALTSVSHFPEGTWLVFFNDTTSPKEFLTDTHVPFDCEFLVALRLVGKTEEKVLLTEVYHVHPTLPLREYPVAKWSSSSGIVWFNTPTTQGRRNLHGITIKAAFRKQVPHLKFTRTADRGQQQSTLSGYVWDLWNEMEERMNFTMILHVRQSENEAEIRNFILSPFTSRLWLTFLVTMLFHTIVLHVTWGVGMKRVTQRVRNRIESISRSALYVIGGFCIQGDSGANWTTSSRLAYFTTHATSLVLFISYSATFISFLTVQHHHLPFSDFQGALDDGTYRVDVLAASADIDYFRKSVDPVFKNVYKKLIEPYKDDLPNNYVEILKRFCSKDKYGAVMSLSSLRGLETYLPCNIVPIPKASFSHMASMTIRKGSPYRRYFSHILQEMRRAGILNALERKYYPRTDDVPPEQPSSVTISRVRVYFIYLGAGVLIAVLLLILETGVHRKTRNV
ncbi:glutamate receptor ionotropic, delta-2-like [Zootermopsis nevadensis]|uniref:glutamate receptor ionotropic, delta-2-like n=1 Tax=Zootermopsis nevadensis TaxID=136037 RepID=UPI000B8EB73D|nr:glutamate receptor ionotropic, delta-2-like [Zootermopsis nevadensis]